MPENVFELPLRRYLIGRRCQVESDPLLFVEPRVIACKPRAQLIFRRRRYVDLVEDQQLQFKGDAIADHVVAAIDTEYVAHGLSGSFWQAAGILALLAATITFTTAAAIRLLGGPGVGLSITLLAFFGLPGSGGPLGYEFLPAFYHSLAQGLPSTAAVSALRAVVYFDGAGAATPLLVLCAWVAGAAITYTAAALLRTEHPHPPALSAHAPNKTDPTPTAATA